MSRIAQLLTPRTLLVAGAGLAATATFSPYLSGTTPPPWFGMMSYLFAWRLLADIGCVRRCSSCRDSARSSTRYTNIHRALRMVFVYKMRIEPNIYYTLYGNITDYHWTGVAGPDAIDNFENAINDVRTSYDGLPYFPPASNMFVNDVLKATGTSLSAGNRATLGCAPGLNNQACF